MSAWLFHLVCRWLIPNYFYLGSALFLILTQSARWLFLKYQLPLFIYEQKLFSADIYASSIYHPSLGDFIVSVSLLLWFLILIRDCSYRKSNNRIVLYIRLLFAAWLSMVLSDASFNSIKSLVFDSQISFDIKNIYAINSYTLLGLLLAFMLLLVAYQMMLRLYKLLADNHLGFHEKFMVIGLVFLFLHPFLVIYLFERNDSYSLASSSLILIFLGYKHFVHDNLNRFQRYFVVVVMLSVITSLTIYYYSNIEEEESRFLTSRSRMARDRPR